MTIHLIRATPLGDTKPRDITIENGRITRVAPSSRAKPNTGHRNAILAPPLFDIQVNGGWGIDLQHDFTPDDVAALSDKLAAHGVGRWVPTIITNAQRTMERACRVLGEALQDRRLRKRIPGIHIEGPYISPENGPRGAHAKQHVRCPNLREFDRLLEAADGRVLYVTVAPEVPNAIPFIRGCVQRGVAVSLGHHNASADQIHRAADAGATLCTHLGNGMPSTINRHANPLWPQLADDRLSASLLADGHHLPPDVLRAFIRAKGPARIILTSDATHLAGMKPGHYDLAGVPVELKRNGRICLTGTDLLAGSASMLLDGVFNAARLTGLDLAQAFAAASTIPARVLGQRENSCILEPGKRAHFIVVEQNGSASPRCLAAYLDGAYFLANKHRGE